MKFSLTGRSVLQSLLVLCILSAPVAALSNTDSFRKELDVIADRFHGKIGYSLHHLKTGEIAYVTARGLTLCTLTSNPSRRRINAYNMSRASNDAVGCDGQRVNLASMNIVVR
jgi:hypothetical protein